MLATDRLNIVEEKDHQYSRFSGHTPWILNIFKLPSCSLEGFMATIELDLEENKSLAEDTEIVHAWLCVQIESCFCRRKFCMVK